MRLPSPGPSVAEVLEKIPLKRALELLPRDDVRALTARANGADYLGWEEFRFRPTPEEAWAVVKWERSAQRRHLGLGDAKGRPFSYVLPSALLAQLHEIDKHAAGELLVDIPEPVPGARDRYVINSLMEEAIASSQIEGAATTRVAAKDMLRSARRPRNRAEQMILNNYATIQRLKEMKDDPLTTELLLDIQASLTRDTLDDPTAAGRLRRPCESDLAVYSDDGTLLHTPPPAEQLPERLNTLCEYANREMDTASTDFEHPVVRAMVLHFWLAYEHPFPDGNGRTARALFHWFMLKQGYWLVEFLPVSQVIRGNRAQYRRAYLLSERDDNDVTYFLAYHLRAIRRALEETREYLRRKQREMQAALERVRGVLLNYRQRALLTHALKNPGFLYTVVSHRTSHGIGPQTARNDLNALAAQKLLDAGRRGRQHIWMAPRDLGQRLRDLERR